MPIFNTVERLTTIIEDDLVKRAIESFLNQFESGKFKIAPMNDGATDLANENVFHDESLKKKISDILSAGNARKDKAFDEDVDMWIHWLDFVKTKAKNSPIVVHQIRINDNIPVTNAGCAVDVEYTINNTRKVIFLSLSWHNSGNGTLSLKVDPGDISINSIVLNSERLSTLAFSEKSDVGLDLS